MQQLSGLDNSFLLMETGGQLGHVAAYSTFDGSGLEPGQFVAGLRVVVEIAAQRVAADVPAVDPHAV